MRSLKPANRPGTSSMNISNRFRDGFFRQETQGWHLSLSVIILVFLVFLTFRGVLKNQFVDWDDFTYVVNNDLVRNPGDKYLKDLFTTPIASNFHPLTILSLRLNNNDCPECPEGISPWPFLAWNVLLHMFNSILVLFFCHLLYRKNLLPALFVSILFAIHPMHIESVAWISERKDVLYTFFFLCGLLCWLMYKQRNGWFWLAATFIAFVFSCLSKATAVVFPVVLILLDFWMDESVQGQSAFDSLRKALAPHRLVRLLPFFLVSLFTGLLAYKIQNGENFLGILNEGSGTPDVVNETGPYSIIQKLSIAGYGFFSYVIRFVIPFKLSALYPLPSLSEMPEAPMNLLFTLSTVGLAAVAGAVLYSLKKTKLFFFGIGFFFVTVALVLQFIPVGMAIMADRYSYVPYIGLAFIPAVLVTELPARARFYVSQVFVVIIVIFILLSVKQVRTWRTTETLWTNVIEKYPDAELPRRSRGKFYSKLSMNAKDPEVKKLLEAKALEDFSNAMASGSRHTDVYEGAGVIRATRKEYDKALEALNKAITYDPENGSAYYNRALVFSELKLMENAIEDYGTALMLEPEKAPEIINNRSNLLLETGRFSEALRDLDYLITRDRNNYILYSNRAIAKEQLLDIRGAIEDYRKALAINSKDSLSVNRLRTLSGK